MTAEGEVRGTPRGPGIADQTVVVIGASAGIGRETARQVRAGGGHLVLESNHPSPLSATRPPVPFIGCGHFGAANRFIAAQDLGDPVDWSA